MCWGRWREMAASSETLRAAPCGQQRVLLGTPAGTSTLRIRSVDTGAFVQTPGLLLLRTVPQVNMVDESL